MLNVFSGLSTNFRAKNSPRVDTTVFKLHYKVSVSILLACCVLVCSRQFIGDPIKCILDSKLPINVINTYCWISSTFSVPYYWNAALGTHAAHPGVGPDADRETQYHAYYQWVPFVLFLQAVMFYFPHWFWKLWDKGKVSGIMLGLDSVSLILREGDRKEKTKRLVHYFMRSIHQHNSWAYGFFLCEVLNLLNVIGNIHFTDKFLGYQFSRLGVQAIKHLSDDPENRTDPLTLVFPRLTKCAFHTFGPSGTVQKHDALCVLATNIINEKIYTFLWFWFVLLAAITACHIVYRLVTLFSRKFRKLLMEKKGRLSKLTTVEVINEKCDVGDWLLIYYLGDNMDPFVYREFLKELAHSMENTGYLVSAFSVMDKSHGNSKI